MTTDAIAVEEDSERRASIGCWIADGSMRVAVAADEIVGYCVTERAFFGHWFVEVLMDCSLPTNAPLRIVSKDHQLEGVVEACVPRQPLGYFVKVKLSPQSRWSERWFTPQHLLQLWSGAPPKVSTLKAASGY